MKAWAPAAVAVLLLPRLADACPMCAGQQPGGVARIVALGLMLLLPFSIAVVVHRALRRSTPPMIGQTSSAQVNNARGERADGVRELSL